MTSQQVMYLRELQKLYTFLQEEKKVLTPLNFSGLAGNRVMYFVRMMDGKTKSLESTHKEMEFLHTENAYLTQKLK